MSEETAYEGYYEITDKTGPSEPEFQCSCGALIWDVELHIHYHQLHGELAQLKRQA